jgi:verruculogen synthase
MTIDPKTDVCPPIRRVDASAGSEAAYQIIQEDGCVIVENVVSRDIIGQIFDDVKPLVFGAAKGSKPGEVPQVINMHNRTIHVGNVVLTSKTYRDEILNLPFAHEIFEKIFRKDAGDYWLNMAGNVLCVLPGAEAQRPHRDDFLYPISQHVPPTGPELMVNMTFALTEFRDDNGGTRLRAKSHHWPNSTFYGNPEDLQAAEMKPGDVLIFTGRAVHGGGQNQSDSPRIGLAMAAQPAYLTPRESNVHLPREIVESMTPLAQKMVGWSTIRNCNTYQLNLVQDVPLHDALNLKSKSS